ncbi:hypothetical protein QQP08_008962 [Theobroma cacao]|nr:hypothetical protein QQP08_008962 [Theobroma cacao]
MLVDLFPPGAFMNSNTDSSSFTKHKRLCETTLIQFSIKVGRCHSPVLGPSWSISLTKLLTTITITAVGSKSLPFAKNLFICETMKTPVWCNDWQLAKKRVEPLKTVLKFQRQSLSFPVSILLFVNLFTVDGT